MSVRVFDAFGALLEAQLRPHRTFCGMQALFSVAYAKQQMAELIGSRQVFVGFALRVGEAGLGVSETTWGVSRFAFS